MNYFILINDVQQGPFTIDELRQRGIRQDTLVWCEGMEQWTPAWKVEELRDLVQTTPTPPPPPLQGGEKQNQQTPPPPPYPGDDYQGQQYQGQQYQGQQNQGAQNQQGAQSSAAGYSGYDGYKGYNNNKKKHHKALWFLLIIIIVLFILALFNPSKAEHRQAILDKIDTATTQVDNIDDPMVRSVVSGIMGMGNGMIKEVVKQLIDDDLEYHNYIIFSTTTLKSDLLRKEIRTSTGFLGHVNAISLSNILPDLIMKQMGIDNDNDSGTGPDDSFDNGTSETTTTTVDGDGNETTETTKTTKKNGVTVDSLTKRVTNRIADEVANKVKKEVSQQSDSATASGINAIINDVLNFLKGL